MSTPRDLLPDRFAHLAEKQPDAPALFFRGGHDGDGPWTSISWGEYYRRSRLFGAACLAAGLPEHGVVAILGDNRPEWLIAATGAQAARGVTAGIYQTSSAEQVVHILRHSEAHLVFLDTPVQWAKVKGSTLPHLRHVILLNGPVPDDPRCVSFADFLSRGEGPKSQAALSARTAAILPADLATLIYTSGTTGDPKGVMLNHHNLAFTTSTVSEIAKGYGPDDVFVSYLPLAHIAEQMLSVYVPLLCGLRVYFCPKIELLRDVLCVARPTAFLGVPRVWEKIKAALEARFSETRGIRAGLLGWARGVATRAGRYRLEKGPPWGLLALEEKAADRLVFRKLKTALGLDRLRIASTGAAPTGLDVLEFFLSISIPLHEVYGQSEDCGPTTFNMPAPGQTRLGTAGRLIPGVEVKLAEDGEILVKGDNVFQGYYKDPEATAATLRDGWLHSGDVGEFDADGFLKVTDRKKDLIKTSGGKYAAPAYLEKLLKGIPMVSQAVVIGEGRRYLTALLTLDIERTRAFAIELGVPEEERADLGPLSRSPQVLGLVQKYVERINQGLARPETIKKFTLLHIDFTPESGELTPTQKVRRKVVHQRYAVEIDAMYID